MGKFSLLYYDPKEKEKGFQYVSFHGEYARFQELFHREFDRLRDALDEEYMDEHGWPDDLDGFQEIEDSMAEFRENALNEQNVCETWNDNCHLVNSMMLKVSGPIVEEVSENGTILFTEDEVLFTQSGGKPVPEAAECWGWSDNMDCYCAAYSRFLELAKMKPSA